MHRCACVRLGQYRPRHGPTQGKKEARRCLPREPAPTTRPVYAGCLTVSEWSSSDTLCINGGWQCACFAKRTETNAQHARRCCTICRRYCVSDRLQLRLHSNIHLHTVSSFVYIYIPVDGNNLVSLFRAAVAKTQQENDQNKWHIRRLTPTLHRIPTLSNTPIRTFTVKLPPGVNPGDTIHVQAPNGDLNEITVPAGMSAGSTFTVEFDHGAGGNGSNTGAGKDVYKPTSVDQIGYNPPVAAATAYDNVGTATRNDGDDGFASGFNNAPAGVNVPTYTASGEPYQPSFSAPPSYPPPPKY